MLIQEKKSLKNYTTFGVDVFADYFIEINTKESFLELLQHPLWQKNTYIIGGGSNILFTDDYHGLIIHNNILGITILSEDDESMIVKTGAGVDWHEFVMWSVEHNVWGIENLALIPGTVGAAPVQNIGAYGVEAKDTISKVHAIDTETGEEKILFHQDCQFGYRDSIFKKIPGKYFITSVEFTLSKIPRLNIEYGAIVKTLAENNITDPSARDMAETIIKIRSSKLPALGEIGMAGSFFKNPIITAEHATKLLLKYPKMKQFILDTGEVKISAAWLIDYLGYKGIQKGKVGTYSKHALVLVNYGDASGVEVRNFAQKIIVDVYDNFSITLQPEVIVI